MTVEIRCDICRRICQRYQILAWENPEIVDPRLQQHVCESRGGSDVGCTTLLSRAIREIREAATR